MQRQNRISDVACIGTPPPIRMETDQAMQSREEHDWPPKRTKISAEDRTLSSDSTVLRMATAAKENLKDYCNATSIHGVRYFAEDSPLLIGKIFWVIAITLSMAGCTLLILKVWQKWDMSPVIVSFSESSTSIWQVPFPAVTICPEIKCRLNVFNFTENYHKHHGYLENKTKSDVGNNVTEDIVAEEIFGVEAVSLLCDKYLLTSGRKTMPAEDTKAFLEHVAPDFKEVMHECQWQGNVNLTCEDLFKPVWSDQGVCFTFNMVDHRKLFTENAVQYGDINTGNTSGDWDLEKSFLSHADTETFPRRALLGGEETGMYVAVAQRSEHDYLCKSTSTGFKVLLHDPAEVPRVGQTVFRAPLTRNILAAVKPSLMTTSPGLQDYAPHRRQCYFPRERQLRFFQVYTQKNCELECVTNFTLKKCGCVEIYMPRDNHTAVCGPANKECVYGAGEESLKLEVQNDIERQIRGERLGVRKTECDCIASCISLGYDVEVEREVVDVKNVLKAHRVNLTLKPNEKYSEIYIFFKETHFLANQRSELYGPTDFLANCGGLLGLFTGFSFISVIEILYFLTIRLWCRLRKRSKRHKSLEASQA